MSETIAPKAPSAAEIAKKEAEDKIKARIAELRTYVGKWFKKKGDNSPAIFEIKAYAGIGLTSKGQAHLFLVEGKNPGTRWQPIAKEFLDEYEPIPTPEPAKEQGVI